MRSRKTRTIATLGAVLLALVAAAPVAARGPDSTRLENNGWFCFDIPPIGLHCDNPGVARRTATEEEMLTIVAWPELVFDSQSGAFLGSEIGLRDDIWRPRPCPRDGDIWIPDLGHMFCHHFDAP